MTVLASDNFIRANENPLSDGGNWTTLPGSAALQLVSDLAESSVPGGAGIGSTMYWNSVIPPADQYAQVTVVTIANLNGQGTDVSAVCRAQVPNANSLYYEGGAGAQQSGPTGLGNPCYIWIGMVHTNAETELAQTVGVVNAGDIFNLTVHGPTILLRQNGAVVLIGADDSLTSGYFGAHSKCDADVSTAQISTWSGGIPSLSYVPFSDSFARANGSLGPNWLNVNTEGPLSISGNQVINSLGSSYGVEASIGSDYEPDQYAQAVISSTGATNYSGVAVRINGNGTGAQYYIPTMNVSYYTFLAGNGNVIALQKITEASPAGATVTNLWVGTQTVTVGDVVRLEILGNTLTAYYNGVVVATYVDSSAPIVGGHPGVSVYGTGVGVNTFTSGSLGVIPPPPSTALISLIGGVVQGANGASVPNGSIEFVLNVDATIVAAPGGFVSSAIPIIFQFDANGNLVQPAYLWSNAELNPQNANGLGTYYKVTIYDKNNARISTPQLWLLNEPGGGTIDIGTMVAYAVTGI